MKVGTNRLGRDKIRGPAEYGFSDSYHPIKNFLRAHLQSTILEIKAIKTQVIEQEAVLNPRSTLPKFHLLSFDPFTSFKSNFIFIYFNKRMGAHHVIRLLS